MATIQEIKTEALKDAIINVVALHILFSFPNINNILHELAQGKKNGKKIVERNIFGFTSFICVQILNDFENELKEIALGNQANCSQGMRDSIHKEISETFNI